MIHTVYTYKTQELRIRTYPIARLAGVPERLHHTAPLVLDVSAPVGLAGRDQYMRAPRLYVSVQRVRFLDFEMARVLNRAAVAVVPALLAVDV